MKTYILTWIYGNKVTEIFQHNLPQIVQLKRKELLPLPQFKQGRFEIRTKEGLKHKLILKNK